MLGHKDNFTSSVNDSFPFCLLLRFSQH